MGRILADSFPHHQAVFFDNALDMIAWLPGHLAETALICLDHDLGASRFREGERFEPGTGRDVVNEIAQHKPCCPVVIHTTNYNAAPGMILALESGGWSVERVVPFDDLAWLDRTWLPCLKSSLDAV